MARPTDKRWKGYLIDWPTIAAMDSEDYELKPLNQQQVAILLMLLEYQKWETRWTNLELSKDELQTYIGDIEERLMRNEGGMATKDDIRDGIYEAMNRLALQVATGQYANIGLSTDEDGTVTPTPDDPTSDLPEDDPLTPIDETQASNYGGTISLSKAIELLYDKLDTYYGAVNGTPATPEATAKTLIKAFFPCDGLMMDTAIASYYTYRTSNGQLAFNTTQAMQLYLYCHGSNERGWGQWLSDQSGYAIAKFTVMNDLSVSLSDEFWTSYYQQGTNKPSTVYLEAGCVPSPTEIMNMPVLGTAYTSQTAWKANHRLLFTVENYFTDSTDSDILDFWWYDAAGVTLPVNRIASVNMQLGAGITKPTVNQVPFAANHKYQFTIDTVNGAGQVQITVPATGITTAVASVAGVGFKVTIQDLGEIFT